MRVASILSVACATLVAAAANTLASSAEYRGAPIAGVRHASLHHRDASTLMSGGNNSEGEAHGPVDVPSGAVLTSLNVQHKTDVAVFWTKDPNNSTAKQAFVMIHGKLRNGNTYWTTMNDALQSAIKDGYAGASADDIVTAPQFYSTKYNSGQYSAHELAWGDVNAWQAGDIATHPSTTDQTSFDALDAFVDEFSDTTKYPAMKNLTFVGHGGGGQLIARYAQVSKDPPSNLHVRYIMGDPSSNSYFTTDRPAYMESGISIDTCPYYNTWRYGYDNFTGTADGKLTPQEYFAKYVRRDIVSIVGYQDVQDSGDSYCMAELQGGHKRRDRNLCWYQYVNGLGRTDEVLDGFPCNYTNLPDWSNMTQNAISLRLVVVKDADHDAAEVFGSSEGRSALFDSSNVVTGWRPSGWKASTKSLSNVGSSNAQLAASPSASASVSNSAQHENSTVTTKNISSSAAPAASSHFANAFSAGVVATCLMAAALTLA